MKLPIYQLDAFTDTVFHGNPAAVCPLEAWLEKPLMQSIATENNLSETAFFVREGERWGIRWFTPRTEVALCGHATLASAAVIHRYIEPGETRILFASESGPLAVTVEGNQYELDFPANPARPVTPPNGLERALGATPLEVLQSQDLLLAVFAEEAEVRALAPEFAALAKLEQHGVIVTAPGGSVDFVSRFFAPAVGIDEDPVTGAAHCVLAPYWSERLELPSLVGRQVSARGGTVTCGYDGERVKLTGRAVTYLRGEIEVPG